MFVFVHRLPYQTAILEQCTQRPSESNIGISADDPQCQGADLTRWYYDSQAGTCLKFTYGGCGNSNSNMFVSRAECLSVCANNSLSALNIVGTEWVPSTSLVKHQKGKSKFSFVFVKLFVSQWSMYCYFVP